MRLYFWLFIFLMGYQSNCFGQQYPSYKITVYDTASKGYYFLCPNKSSPTPHNGPTNMILDDKGRVIYYAGFKAVQSVGDFKLWPNGLMSYYCNNIYYLMDSNFNFVDSLRIKNGYAPDTHDMQILPNGHFLLMGAESDTMDLSAYHYFNHNGTPGSKKASVVCGVIQEQDKNKNVVFEWHAKDHYDFSDVDSTDLSSPTRVDWNHLNGLASDNDGNILLSVRWFNEITKISRKDGSIIWRLGGKKNQFAFSNDTNGFIGQHDIRRIANGDITMYDNGLGGSHFHPATAREYKLDETKHTANLVWSYVNNPKSFSLAIGNVQRNPTGNTLIDYGIVNNENLVFNVLDPSGKKVFETAFDDTSVSYRSFNYLSLPWRLNRPQITCSLSNGKYYLDAGSGYAKYLWNTGDTTRTIEASKSDTFSVFVPIGKGGFIRSEYFITSGHSDPCGLAAIHGNPIELQFSLFPNPVSDELIVQSASFQNKEIPVQIFDIAGKKVSQSINAPFGNRISLHISTLPKGMYVIDIEGVKRKFVKE